MLLKDILVAFPEVFRKRRIRRAVCFIVAALFFAIYAFLHAVEHRHQPVFREKQTQHQENCMALKQLTEKFEEISWLVKKGECESSLHNQTPSMAIYGYSVPSFDRLMMMLKAHQLFMGGVYEDFLEFVHAQPKVIRFNFEQFQEISRNLNQIVAEIPSLTKVEVVEAMQLAIVIHEVAKTETAKNKGAIYEIYENSHCRFLESVLARCPDIFPSYGKLKRKQQQLVEQITLPFCFEQVFLMENGEAAFEKLLERKVLVEKQKFIDLSLYVFACCYAGKCGSHNSSCSTMFTASAYKQMLALNRAMHICFESGAAKAYEHYLESCTAELGLDPGSPLNRALTKIAVRAEISNKEAGRFLKEAFLKLSPEDLKVIVGEFGHRDSKGEKKMRHFATLLKTALQSEKMGVSFRERVSRMVSLTLPVLAKALHSFEEIHQKKGNETNIKLDFSTLLPLCEEDPNQLEKGKVNVDSMGRVLFTQEAL